MRVPSSVAIFVAAANKYAWSNFKHALHGPKGGGQEPEIEPHIYHSLLSLADGGADQKNIKQAKAKAKKAESKDKTNLRWRLFSISALETC